MMIDSHSEVSAGEERQDLWCGYEPANMYESGDMLPMSVTGLLVVECCNGLMVKMLCLTDLQRHAVIAVLHGVEHTPEATVTASLAETEIRDVAGTPAQVVVDTSLPHRADLT